MKQKDKGHWGCKFKLEKRRGDINAYNTPEKRLAFLKCVKPF